MKMNLGKFYEVIKATNDIQYNNWLTNNYTYIYISQTIWIITLTLLWQYSLTYDFRFHMTFIMLNPEKLTYVVMNVVTI